MKRISLIALMFLGAAGFAVAQKQNPTSDVLGAHLNYGRGCAACHAPHSGAWGNGANVSGDKHTGNSILWGQDVGNLYGKTIAFAGQSGPTTTTVNGVTTTTPGNAEVLPSSLTATTPDVEGILTCMSCHDGNYATGAMMQKVIYETPPATYGPGAATIPTLLGNDGDGVGTASYITDHPVGLSTAVGCGGQHNWDCTETAGVISMTGPNSAQFVKNYGFFVSLSAYNNTAVVTCTSCHNQHLMNVVSVTNGAKSGLPTGFYATMFFIRAPFNPASGTAGSNQTAQFCRQCHGGEANESNGGGALPTIF